MMQMTAAMAALLILGLGSASARAQSWQPPTDEQRCPSPWGADDVLRAARLIQSGEVVEMGYPLHADMPFYGDRIYNQQIKRTRWSTASNPRGSNEEIITTELGQVGTQIDGFGHQSIGDSHYNCFKTDEIVTRTGFSKLGMENSGGFFTRGVLLDVAAARNVTWYQPSEYVTVADFEVAERRQNVRVESGDVLFVRTGMERMETELGEQDVYPRAGLHAECAEWMHDRQVAVYGGDCIEKLPYPSQSFTSAIHMILLASMGMPILDWPALTELAETCERLNRWEYLLTTAPLRLPGGTSSPLNPLCVF
jgi:kynurenine formamidase